MKSAKRILAIVLSVLMLALCAVPVLAETEYEYTPETCPGHSFETTVIEPTCAKQGYTTHVCERCGFVYNNNFTDPTGNHDWQTVTEQAATCGAAGYKQEKCSVCGNIRTANTPATGAHTWAEDVDRYHAPTCARAGEKYYTCSVCGDQYAENVPATGAHVDANGDNLCDNCGVSVRTSGDSAATSFMKSWNRFLDFFWQIILRIQKMFS